MTDEEIRALRALCEPYPHGISSEVGLLADEALRRGEEIARLQRPFLLSCPWCGCDTTGIGREVQTSHLIQHGDAFRERLSRLEAALRFYADLKNWSSATDHDEGAKARAALETP